MSSEVASLIAALGARHLDATARGAVADRFDPAGWGRTTRVRLAVADHTAAGPAGQHLAWMTTNLLARQYGVVGEIQLVAPAASTQDRVAHFAGQGNLAASLAAAVAAVAGPTVAVEVCDRPRGRVDVAVAVGMGAPIGSADVVVAVEAAGWCCTVGDPARLAPLAGPADTNPIGAYLGACLAAGEVFKRALGLRPGRGRYLEAFGLSGWDWTGGELIQPSSLAAGDWGEPVALAPCYLIGAGAVAQALLATLVAAGINGHIVVIDHDVLDASNLNRYPLATPADQDRPKVDLAAEHLRRAGIGVTAYHGRWPVYAEDPGRGPRPADLADAESRYGYEHVISAVDRNPARHAIQRFWPRRLLGASTFGLALEVHDYDMTGPFECLLCANPVAAEPTLEQAADELRRLDAAELDRVARARGVDPELLRAVLDDPRCGQAGQWELARFLAAGGRSDYAVGFVSVAAGVLAAAQQLRRALTGTTVFDDGQASAARLNLLNPMPTRTRHLRRSGCECRTTGTAAYRALWAGTASRTTW
jgi:molybdopterin/thiamine biosynthesis adenylyltransferase